MAANSRHDYFVSPIRNEARNKNTAVYLAARAQGTANNTKLALLNSDARLTIFAVKANNKIIFVHSFRNLDGPISQPRTVMERSLVTGASHRPSLSMNPPS